MPFITLHPDINFLSSSGINLYSDSTSITNSSGYRIEASNNNSVIVTKQSTGSISLSLLSISSSNNEPRIGFGYSPNEAFEKTFEIKSSKNSQFGTEFVLKSSRLNKGGEVGDYAGTIDFVIDSGSYKKVNISGSIADIKAEVTNISEQGATGDIILSTAYNPKLAPAEVLRINGVTSTFSSSLRVMGDSLTVDSTLISNGITQLNGNTIINNITSSGNISSSQDISSDRMVTNGFYLLVDGSPKNEVTFFSDETVFDPIYGNILKETSSANFKFFRQGEGNYVNSSALELTGSLIITGSATIKGPLTITGSQLITDDITSDGTIRARVKSFDIPHPTRKGKRLVYGALEGPEHGIYCRGESKELQVLLPPEWRALIDKKGISVQITPIGEWQPLYFKKFHSNWIHFGCGDNREEVHFFWEIKGERIDVPKLETVQ
jgi:hypothetical protein